MKAWKLISGILSIIFFSIVSFQSCAVGFVNAVEDNASDTSGGAGMIVAFLLLVGGVVSICVRKSKGKGGNIALFLIFGLAALIGLANGGTYKDLVVWSAWCGINAFLAFICILKAKKPAKEEKTEE